MIKAVTFFLIGMLALALFGKLRLPKRKPKKGIRQARKCSECGTYIVGPGPCPCKGQG